MVKTIEIETIRSEVSKYLLRYMRCVQRLSKRDKWQRL